jgi:putative ABC transport system permease protein
VRAFKKDGEYAGENNYLFTRKSTTSLQGRPPRNLLVRVRPGAMTGAFEKQLADRLQATVRSWSFDVRPLDRVRASALRIRLVPLYVVGGIAVFFMLMVGMGLMGVLWQTVTQRTGEIGLRRALGGSARDIRIQVIGELLVVAAFGSGLGALVAVQFPLLGLIGFIPAAVYGQAFAAAAAALFVLTVGCALYPSTLALRLAPATALHEA